MKTEDREPPNQYQTTTIAGRATQYRFVQWNAGGGAIGSAVTVIADGDDKTKRAGQSRIIGYADGEIVRSTAREWAW